MEVQFIANDAGMTNNEDRTSEYTDTVLPENDDDNHSVKQNETPVQARQSDYTHLLIDGVGPRPHGNSEIPNSGDDYTKLIKSSNRPNDEIHTSTENHLYVNDESPTGAIENGDYMPMIGYRNNSPALQNDANYINELENDSQNNDLTTLSAARNREYLEILDSDDHSQTEDDIHSETHSNKNDETCECITKGADNEMPLINNADNIQSLKHNSNPALYDVKDADTPVPNRKDNIFATIRNKMIGLFTVDQDITVIPSPEYDISPNRQEEKKQRETSILSDANIYEEIQYDLTGKGNKKKHCDCSKRGMIFILFCIVCVIASVIIIPTVLLLKDPSAVQSSFSVLDLRKHDYAEVIGLSILFYEAQRSGKLPDNNRVSWRGDSALTDGSDVGHNLTGGWYDDGGYVKFGFTMAAATTVLAHGILEFEDAYKAAFQYDNALDSIKWPLDYFIKCHTIPGSEFYAQVGNGQFDNNYWGRPEEMRMSRPAYRISVLNPGSDLAGETVAALAAGSLVFKGIEDEYSKLLLSHAKRLYNLIFNYGGKYSDSINGSVYYTSHGTYYDERAWAAAWLYRATGNNFYLTDAKTAYSNIGTPVEFSWDDKGSGVHVLLYQLTGEKVYAEAIERFVDGWLPDGGKRYTPKGLVWHSKFGPNRYAANAAYIALMAAKLGIRKVDYVKFATSQINYMLGDGGQSFVVGYGAKNDRPHSPQTPHHRSSSCPDVPSPCNWRTGFENPGPNYQKLYGALVGGPDEYDNFIDDRKDFITNAVAVDFNAGFQTALAGLNYFELLCQAEGC